MGNVEMWKDVNGYVNELQVSSEGRVRVIETRYDIDTMEPIYVCRLLNQVEMNQDYLGVNYDGKGFFVHQIVAKAFIPNPENKRLIVHKDKDKHHNSADNMEWQTNSECAKEALETGVMQKPTGYRGYIIECVESGEIFYGIKATAKKLMCKLSQLENAVYRGESLNGLHYNILHNYTLQRHKRPDIFENEHNTS